MDEPQPNIPEFSQGKSASLKGGAPRADSTDDSKPSNFTPLDNGGGGSFLNKLPGGKKFALGLVGILLLILPVVGYYVYTTTQTTIGEAMEDPCLADPVNRQCLQNQNCPRTVLVQCKDNSYKCAYENKTFERCGDGCKRVNQCTLKCRNENGLEYIVNECETQPTPTPYVPQGCPVDTECIDEKTAVAIGCADANTTPRCSTPGSNTDNGFCCKKPECPPPNQCINIGTGADPNTICQEGTLQKEGTIACHTQVGPDTACCVPTTPVPTFTPTPTPTEAPTPTPTDIPSGTPTPTDPPQCTISVDVEVECLTCSYESQ